jgi:hypothetical protein
LIALALDAYGGSPHSDGFLHALNPRVSPQYFVPKSCRTTLGEKESLHAELHREIEDGKTTMALLEARCLNLTKERETAIEEKDDAVAKMAQRDAVLARALERAERSEEEVTVLRKELEEARQAAKAAETDADR